MKILVILPAIRFGGAEVLVTNICTLLCKQGHEVKLLTFFKLKNHLTQLLEVNGIELLCSNTEQNYSLSNIFFVVQQIAKYRPDIVHAHLTPGQFSGMLASFVANRSFFVTTEHSTSNRRRKWYWKLFDIIMYSRYKKIVAISKATQEKLIEWIPSLEKKIVIISNGIDMDKFKCDPNRKKHNRKILNVMCVAGFRAIKGHDVLIKAIAHTSGLRLVLIGSGKEQQRIKDMALHFNISNRVVFLGERSNVQLLLKHADIYVQPSLNEGFGIAAVEAMAAGLPVVVSDVPGLSDIVSDAGICFRSGDHMRLRDCLMLLAHSPELRKEYSSRGIERAKIFSIQSTVNEYLNLFQSVEAQK